MEIIKIGNVVKLKSGGPDMVVKGFQGERKGESLAYQLNQEMLECNWFLDEEVKSAFFHRDSLQLVKQ